MNCPKCGMLTVKLSLVQCATGDAERPAMLWPVDGASIRINARWDGDPETPRYAQALPGQLESSAIELRDGQLMYIRMNPRSFTPFGLGPLEVAFETVNQFLSAHRFAGKLASNAVAQYALWLNEATPAQHDRLIGRASCRERVSFLV